MLGGFDLALLWGNLGVSLLVVVAGAILVPALSLPSAFVAIAVGCLIGNLMLARRRTDRRPGAGARDDADAGAARLARLVPADRDQRRPVPRLDGVRAARDRDRRSGAVRGALRRRGAVGVDARLRRGGARAGARRPDRRRAHGAAPRRDLGRAGRDRLPGLVGARRRRPLGGVERSRRGRPLDLAGDRHRRRRHRLVGAARGRLHALRAHAARRLLGDGHRLPRCRTRLLLGLGAVHPAHARRRRCGGAAGGRRGGRASSR